ncbi:HesA/MoeB/ThiF family protein [Paracoccus aerodenitrificans]|uniref:HesA/MoeB/ThiF family protein n=1 Tax=Paracoccus aerodenitrificans TaxID=3017781 RepID=UPI0022F13712|nr:HesA/MoeB/ThiF family protein [Paracoccus aerodenitrificans]WBU65016.1 HesA/MoeB/ThiF family protein [Paracoccus aerodenitrificans]
MALLLPLGLLSVAAVAWIMGWGVLRVLLGLLVMWLVVLGFMLAAPAAEIRSFSNADIRTWLATGVFLAIILGYMAVLRRLRAGAEARWGDPQARANEVPSDAGAADDTLDRYARHYVLREIGGPGQARLRDASVLLIGAGGLGAPASLYLAAAGVGRLTIADPDVISVSNLQRQIIYRTRDAGQPKAALSAEALRALNPHVEIAALQRRIGEDDADLIANHDLVLDGGDSFADRTAINAACVRAGVPLISGSIAQWEGQLTVYDPARDAPCMSCVFPEPPAPGLVLPCAEAGVAGPLPGVIGSMMALEAIKHLTGAGPVLRGEMLIYDGLYGETRKIRLHRRSDCPVCSGLAQPQPEA